MTKKLHLIDTYFANDKYNIGSTSIYYNDESFMWGKAHRVNDHEINVLQYPVSCKDYIIDMKFALADQQLPNKKKVMPVEERNSTCIYMFLPKGRQALFFKNLKEFLHPYEVAHGFSKTKVSRVTKKIGKHNKVKPFIIEGDRRWNNNTFLASHYYSLLRLMTVNDTMCLDKLPTIGINRRVNEEIYLSRLSDQAKKVYTYFWSHIEELDMKFDNTRHPQTGFLKTYVHYHGCAGIYQVFGVASSGTWSKLNPNLMDMANKNPLVKYIYDKGVEVLKS